MKWNIKLDVNGTGAKSEKTDAEFITLEQIEEGLSISASPSVGKAFQGIIHVKEAQIDLAVETIRKLAGSDNISVSLDYDDLFYFFRENSITHFSCLPEDEKPEKLTNALALVESKTLVDASTILNDLGCENVLFCVVTASEEEKMYLFYA